MFGVFRVENHDFMPKNLFFSNFRGEGGGGGGGGAGCPSPWIRPWRPYFNVPLEGCLRQGFLYKFFTLYHKHDTV
jgi:hypothetical protein